MSGERQVVVCVGNRYRRDDSAALYLADRLRSFSPRLVEIVTLEGEPTALLEIFDSSQLVILVDAVATDGVPGLIRRFDATDQPVPGSVFGASTHAFGLSETIELARALGKLHGTVLVYGINGQNFSAGEGLSPQVASAMQTLAVEILNDLNDRDGQPAEGRRAAHARASSDD